MIDGGIYNGMHGSGRDIIDPEPRRWTWTWWRRRGMNDMLHNRPRMNWDDAPDYWSDADLAEAKAAYAEGEALAE